MIVVGLDCSGDDFLLGLVVDNRIAGSWRIAARRRHAELLPGEIFRRLEQNGCIPTDIGGFSIISGPGSYTGLRVGAATVMGLAAVSNLPVAALSSFEFLWREHAVPDKPLGCIIPCRGELYYWCVFPPGGDSFDSVRLLTALEIIQSLAVPTRITGPRLVEIEKLLPESPVAIELHPSPTPDAGGRLALWGYEKIRAGETIDWGNWQLDYGPLPGFRRWSKPTR